MKKILFSLLLLSLSIKINAQCPPRAENFTWDWRGDNDYSFVIRDLDRLSATSLTFKSPWFNTLQANRNTVGFRDEYPKDYEFSDGWVLVQRDFGTTSPLLVFLTNKRDETRFN